MGFDPPHGDAQLLSLQRILLDPEELLQRTSRACPVAWMRTRPLSTGRARMSSASPITGSTSGGSPGPVPARRGGLPGPREDEDHDDQDDKHHHPDHESPSGEPPAGPRRHSYTPTRRPGEREDEGSGIWRLLLSKVDPFNERGQPGRLTMTDDVGDRSQDETPGGLALRGRGQGGRRDATASGAYMRAVASVAPKPGATPSCSD